MQFSSEVLSDTGVAALLGEDTFAGLDKGLERLWAALQDEDEVAD